MKRDPGHKTHTGSLAVFDAACCRKVRIPSRHMFARLSKSTNKSLAWCTASAAFSTSAARLAAVSMSTFIAIPKIVSDMIWAHPSTNKISIQRIKADQRVLERTVQLRLLIPVVVSTVLYQMLNNSTKLLPSTEHSFATNKQELIASLGCKADNGLQKASDLGRTAFRHAVTKFATLMIFSLPASKDALIWEGQYKRNGQGRSAPLSSRPVILRQVIHHTVGISQSTDV